MNVDIRNMRRIKGANMDIDLISQGRVAWDQEMCPWNKAESTDEHRCAIKDVSICKYFCGIEYLDTVICCYPEKNPYADEDNK
jgi:hypothetical protein